MSVLMTETVKPSIVESNAQGEMLARVLELFDREGLEYCLLHGYDDYPHRVRSDVDMLMPRAQLPRRLANVLRRHEKALGARIVQWIEDRAHFIVLSKENGTQPPVMLQLHVSTDYEVENRVILRGEEILRTKRKHERGFWVPAPHVEFGCTLANRIAKASIEDRHATKLSSIWADHPQYCGDEVFRFFGRNASVPIVNAARSGDWSDVRNVIKALRRDMLMTTAMRQPLGYLGRIVGTQLRRVARWSNPKNGLHVVFLGPDGVGKSTVIDAFKQQVEPAFTRVSYKTFAGSLLANKPKESPHSLPVRPLHQSLMKVCWWLWCYTVGFYKSTHPTKARGGLAINHRYLIDAIVDPKRYRYSASTKLIRMVWNVSPKPNILIFLDAPPDVIMKRKQEVAPEEVVRMRDGYRALAAQVKNAVVVDTNQPIEQTIAQTNKTVLDYMAARIAARFGAI